MWPILLLSIATLGVVLERVWFVASHAMERKPEVVEQMLGKLEQGDIGGCLLVGSGCTDGVAEMIRHGIEHKDVSLSNALIQAAGRDLDRFNRGLVVLDTAVTLGPLLGLLGTVIGMMHSFGIVGGADLAGKTAAITGGIAESLIAVSFGLGVAIVAVIPFNYLNSIMDKRRRELEDVSNHVELLLQKYAKRG